MNSKFLLAIMAVAMLMTAGCISVIRVPGENITDEDEISADLDEIEDEFTSSADDSGLPTKTVVEGELVSFPNLKATDPDGDPITYTFTGPLDSDGEWRTEVGDAGRYTVTITASDGMSEVSQDVVVIVKALNNPPVIESLGSIEVDEGETVSIEPEVSDKDGDDVKITFSGWMSSSTKMTDYDDAGVHSVTVTASDGKGSATRTVTVTVNDVNRAPKISSLSDVKIDEGERVSVDIAAADPDGDEVELSISAPIGNDGVWQTEVGDDGVYEIEVTATDGSLEDVETFTLTVNSVNKAPVLKGVEDIEAVEGDTIRLSITAADPEGDRVSIAYSNPFDDDGEWNTGYDDAGEYVVTVTASDGEKESEETFTVTVANKNRPPMFGEGAFD